MSAPPPPYNAGIAGKIQCPPASAPPIPPPYGAEIAKRNHSPPAAASPLPDKVSVVDIFHHLAGSTPPHSNEVALAPKKKKWSFSFTSRKEKEPREMTLRERTALAKRKQKEAEKREKEEMKRKHREKCEKIYWSLHANITRELESLYGEVIECADSGKHECHVTDITYPKKFIDATSFIKRRRHTQDDDYKSYREIVDNVVNDMNRTFMSRREYHRLKHEERTIERSNTNVEEFTPEDKEYLSDKGLEHKTPYEYTMKIKIYLTWK